MDRVRMIEALDKLYAARCAGDVPACVACFSNEGSLRLANVEIDGVGPLQAIGAGQLAMVLTVLVKTWEWLEHEVLSQVIDESSAAVRFRLRTRHASGEVVETELMDHVEFDEEGKVTQFIEFLDTALIARLPPSL